MSKNEGQKANQDIGEKDQDYAEADLKPGGSGKVGDQQQFGEDREKRKDKSHSSGDSDKKHGA